MAGIEAEYKLSKFEKDIKNQKIFNEKLTSLFITEYDEIINDILNLKEDLFIDQIKEGVSLILEDLYTDYCLTEPNVQKLMYKNLEEIKIKYKADFSLVNDSWNTYEKSYKKRSNKDFYLAGFRKHCIYTEENASHNCLAKEKDGDKNCRFIIVNNIDDKKGIKFVICENCKKVYYSYFILARCYKCKVDYYTSLLYPDENPDILLATWENYHCPQLINEKMKCINCHERFYINMKNGLLTCLNKNCLFISKPSRILWTCCTCKKDFKSGAIPYNPLDIQITKKLILQTILLKHKAHPKKMICGCKLNIYFTDFYHNKKCDGILYESELDDNAIIVCEKCKMITYYDRFIWICPKCKKKFKNGIGDNNNYIINDDNENENPEEIHIDIIDKNKKEINDNIKIKSSPSPKHLKYASKRLKNYKLKQEQKLEEINKTEKEEKEEKKEEEKKEEEKKEEKNIINGRWKKRRYSSNHPKLIQDVNNNIKEKEKEIETEKKKITENKEKEEDNNINKEQKKEEEKKYYKRFRHREQKEIEIKIEDNTKEEKEKDNIENKNNQRYISPRNLRRRKFNFSNHDLGVFGVSNKNEKEEKEIPKEKSENLNKKKIINSNIILNRISPEHKKIKSMINENKQEENLNELKNDVSNKEKNSNDDNGSLQFEESENSSELDEEKEEKQIENKEQNKNQKSNGFNKYKYVKKKTIGKILCDVEESSPESPRKNKKKNAPQIQVKIAMSKIPGISEHLFNHINKRMTAIINRCKIPIFNIDDYVFNEKLGEGGYAVIFSVFKKDDEEQKQYALKKIVAKTLTEIDKFTKEFEIMHNCIHENIMKIYGICIRILDQTTYVLYVLMELSERDWDKDIKAHIAKKKYYSEKKLINILRQLTSALLFMKQNYKISHRDIKPQNVLLFNGIYKLADFGEAKKANENTEMNTLRGTELFMSPVLYSGLKHDKNDVNHDPFKSDVFSLGFCFLYAASLNFDLLYKVRNIYNSNIMNKILEENLNNKYSNIFITIISKMLDTDESERFNFEELVEYIEDKYDKEGNLKEENNENNIDNNKNSNIGLNKYGKKFKK